MEAVLERPKTSFLFDRKMTDEEIEEILEHWNYDPSYYDDDDDSGMPAPVWDKYGNPTRETLDAMYESRHGIGYVMTVEEAIQEIHEACRRE
ncbi:MAG: hypothetical protein IJ587_12280 [Synergistaceae bacterium]|nr:hypothetical protein [Synergistaceae bacterium]